MCVVNIQCSVYFCNERQSSWYHLLNSSLSYVGGMCFRAVFLAPADSLLVSDVFQLTLNIHRLALWF